MSQTPAFVSDDLFDLAPVPLSWTPMSADGTPIASYWNRAWCDTFGYALAHIQGKQGNAFNLWRDEPLRETVLARAHAEGTKQVVEADMRVADGRWLRVIVTVQAVHVQGQYSLLTAYQDVTAQRELDEERARAESSLREFREMVESANDAMLLVEDFYIIECNPAAERLYGLPRERLIGSRPQDLSPGHQRDGASSDEAAVALLTKALSGERQQFRWQHKRPDGNVFTAEVTLNPARAIHWPGESPRLRTVVVLRDVTESERAAQALQASEQRFRQLFERAPVALALVDASGPVHAINRRWSELFGYEIDEVPTIDAWWAKAYPDEAYRVRAQTAWQMGLSALAQPGGEIRPTEFRVRCHDGQHRHVLIGGAMIGRELMTSFYDVTDIRMAQRELEELNATLEKRVDERTEALRTAIDDLKKTRDDLVRSEKLASLGALVAGVAHELNTPIGNAVMVASTLADHNKRFAEQVQLGLRRSVLEQFLANWQESTEVIERNLRRAAELIASFKQVAVDQSSYQRRPFELAEVIHEMRLTLSPTLRRSQVELEEDVASPVRMDSYPGPLTQVLMNLVNNAVAHAFEHVTQPKVVRIVCRMLDAQRVRIQVQDNGCGIDEANLARIFDPFFTTKMGRGGSGLGLHIVYTLVTDLLGGTVQAQSQKGQGSCITLELPLVAPDKNAALG